jgi:hypothetical protein
MSQTDKITALLSNKNISSAAIDFAEKIANNETLMKKILQIIAGNPELDSKRNALSEAIIKASKNQPAASKIIVEQVAEKSELDLAMEGSLKAHANMTEELKKLANERRIQKSTETRKEYQDNDKVKKLQQIYDNANENSQTMWIKYTAVKNALKEQGKPLVGGRNRRTKKTKYSSKQITSKRVNKKQKTKKSKLK